MSSELTHFSHMVLGARRPRRRRARTTCTRWPGSGRIYDWVGESQYYVEPKRLARLGYLDARKEPGKTRERTVYPLTAKGLEALQAWARHARSATRGWSTSRSRGSCVADLVDDGAVRAEPRPRSATDIADLSARLDDAEAAAEAPPAPPQVPARGPPAQPQASRRPSRMAR